MEGNQWVKYTYEEAKEMLMDYWRTYGIERPELEWNGFDELDVYTIMTGDYTRLVMSPPREF